MQAVFHSDPGHGWLALPRSVAAKSGVLDKVSSCSYQHGHMVYLEEDCDAPKVIEGLKAIGIELDIIDKSTNRESSIRRMDSFRGRL